MKRLNLSLSLCTMAFIFPIAANGQTPAKPPARPATQAKPAPTHTVAKPASAATDPALLHPSALVAKSPDMYEVKFTTTKGDFVVQITRAWSPLGADRFYNLVKHGFFTDASFFRVVPGFMVQFGMSANPKITAALDSAGIKDEPVKQSNKAGYITYAKSSAPNSRSTQVFINLVDNARNLDGLGFAPFGQVTSGMDVVQQLYGGYGDLAEMGGNGPSASRVAGGGKAYLDKNFAKLDSIKSATIISPAAASGGAAVHRPAPRASGSAPKP